MAAIGQWPPFPENAASALTSRGRPAMCCGEASRPRLSLRAPAAPEHRPLRVPAPLPARDIAVPGMHEPHGASPVHTRAAPRTFVRLRGCTRTDTMTPIKTSLSQLRLLYT